MLEVVGIKLTNLLNLSTTAKIAPNPEEVHSRKVIRSILTLSNGLPGGFKA